jgi:hypothetical protein
MLLSKPNLLGLRACDAMRLLKGAGVFIILYALLMFFSPTYEANLIDRIANSSGVSKSDAISSWIDKMTYCSCSSSPCSQCKLNCENGRMLNWQSVHTIATGIFAGSFVLTPFISRHWVFVNVYKAAILHSDKELFVNPNPCIPSKGLLEPQTVVVISTLAMLLACVANYIIGSVLSIFTMRSRASFKLAVLMDRWGLWVIAFGFLVPFGFPIGISTLYLGYRRVNFGGFVCVVALGCVCHILVLVNLYEKSVHLIGI